MKLRGFAVVLVGLLTGACGSTITAVETTTVTVEAAKAKGTTARTERPTAGKTFAVAKVIDGDTIALRNGKRVRLVQIDAPESQTGECFGQEATAVLSAILPRGTRVTLETDPKLNDVDRYDRLLRYVFKGDKNVNLVLVARGAASVWFYEGDKGRYAKRLLKSAKQARTSGRGLWDACPATKLDPVSAIKTSNPQPPEPPPEKTIVTDTSSNCHPSYTGACLDPSASDYDCEGGEGNGPLYTGTVTVVGYDEYELDRDRDGFGCE